jgi:DNA-binding LytR/AlgR family response regulator
MSSERSILIVEDDYESAIHLQRMLHDMGYHVAGTVASVQMAVSLVQELKPDMVISALEIGGAETGLEIAEVAKASELPVILIANPPDEATFEKVKAVQPMAFIVKPFDRYTLQGAIELAETNRPEAKPELVFVKNNNLLVQIRPSDVLYVHAEGNYCTVFMRNNKKLALKMSLPQFSDILSPEDFIKVHRNYTVRVSEIESISLSHNELTINGQLIPISRQKYRDDLLRRVKMIK